MSYNGYPDYDHWNVALWIGNDEGLYRMAQRILRQADNATDAAHRMLAELRDMGLTKTPDGVTYRLEYLRYYFDLDWEA